MSSDIEVAVVGRFQVGKSSLINCLLGRSVAKIGNDDISETPICSDPNDPHYRFCDDVVFVDTPGVDDKSERDEMAEKAIRQAQCVIFVKDNDRGCGLLESRWIDIVRDACRPCVFILNCKRLGQRSYLRPDSEYNAEFCKSIHNDFIVKNKAEALFLPIGGSAVLPVNVCWAQYGLGILENAEKSQDVEELFSDKFDVLPEALQAEAFRMSNVGILRRFFKNVRLELLSHFLMNREVALSRLVDRFCEEFSNHMAG